MRAGCRLSLILALTAVTGCEALAQTLPWPTDSPRAAAPPAGPGMAAAPMAAPTPTAVPMTGGFGPAGAPPMMGARGMGAPPGFGGGGAPPACLQEFIKLREDVQKKGQAAKALSEHKPSREEMCKQITVYAAAETKWVKYTESNAANCGIPAQLVQELRNVHGHTEQTREKICQPGVASGAPPRPV